jgi:hypothetical protein
MTDINDPPWVVEIDGIKFATPEAVVILLQAVSEERDAFEEALAAIVGYTYQEVDQTELWVHRTAKEALDA